MTIGELIEKLQKIDKDKTVIHCNDDMGNEWSSISIVEKNHTVLIVPKKQFPIYG